MCERVEGKAGAVDTPIGKMPRTEDLDTGGMDISSEDLAELLNVDTDAFIEELQDLDSYMAKVGDRLPGRMKKQIEEYKERLKIG